MTILIIINEYSHIHKRVYSYPITVADISLTTHMHCLTPSLEQKEELVNKYLICRHAEERNRTIADRNGDTYSDTPRAQASARKTQMIFSAHPKCASTRPNWRASPRKSTRRHGVKMRIGTAFINLNGKVAEVPIMMASNRRPDVSMRLCAQKSKKSCPTRGLSHLFAKAKQLP